MTAVIRIAGLDQGYGRKPVLEGISLEIPAGQTLALLGRNGAGKTTLIRTLMGLIEPRKGGVEILGHDPAREPIVVRQKVGYLAEDQSMYGWMTAFEIGRHLSKGQSVRLGLALALAHRPRLMILDDPALGLDPIARKEFNRDLIEHLQAEGRTVLYSSHLLSEVEAVADAVAILDGGRLVRTGPTEEVQRAVKRVLLSASALETADLIPPERLLDVQRHGERIAVTLDEAEPWIRDLRAGGIDADVQDLSLDEIFEAFVIGRPENWPRPSTPAEPAAVPV